MTKRLGFRVGEWDGEVGVETYLEIVACKEALAALFTSESLNSAMDLHVLAQVALLLECLVAVRARKWAVIGVGQQVVNEDVPISEELIAMRHGAIEQPDRPGNLWHLVLNDNEGVNLWYKLFEAQLAHIEVGSFLDEEKGRRCEPLSVFELDRPAFELNTVQVPHLGLS